MALECLEQRLAVVRAIAEYLDERGVTPSRCPDQAIPATPESSFAQLRQMVEDLEWAALEGRDAYYERNLGFIQGVLWGYGCKSLYELRTMERGAGVAS